MTIYALEQVTQCFAGRKVLDIDELKIYPGQIYGLLGANGAGKTTLFHILAFLTPPTSGTVKFNKLPVDFGNKKHLLALRRQVVMVDQYPILFSTSVTKNIEFGLKVRNVGTVDRQRIVDEVLEMVDMRQFKFESVQGLSGGETQRIALARALALSPKVFLCDEPTASVDVVNQAAIIGILKQINEEKGITILFTSHDRLQAAGLAHYTVVLEQGKLASTTYENVYSCDIGKTDGKDMVRCQLQRTVLFHLPASFVSGQSGRKRVYLNPEKMFLGGRDALTEKTGMLQGKVIMIMEEGERVRVVVNVGVVVAAVVSRNHYLKKKPLVGDSLKLRFTAGAFVILES